MKKRHWTPLVMMPSLASGTSAFSRTRLTYWASASLTDPVNGSFTDLVNANVMDKAPFVKWDVITDESPPYDVLTQLQKSHNTTPPHRTF